jgi:hypothetical protein
MPVNDAPLLYCDVKRRRIMKRRILVFLCAGVLMAVGAAPALGDTGPSGPPVSIPGDTFPEQPGEPVPGCEAVTTNPGTTVGGVFDQHAPTFVNDQTTALILDACFGIPE